MIDMPLKFLSGHTTRRLLLLYEYAHIGNDPLIPFLQDGD